MPGVKCCKQRLGLRMLRVELNHPKTALEHPPKLFCEGACVLAGSPLTISDKQLQELRRDGIFQDYDLVGESPIKSGP